MTETIEEAAEEEMEEQTEETCEESEACEEEEACEGAEPKKGLFGKVKKEKKDKKDIQIEELTDKYKRTFAEFDNFRKRTEKEMAQQKDFGARLVIEKMLPIVDSFERGLATLSEEERKAPFADGMDKVYKQLTKAMEELGVTPIEAVGKEFDPAYHNAVMQGEDENLGENIVSEEFVKGYMYHDSVVRHSMVKVVNC
ncbi:MAG: nucleotide exchange factor GrpE [Lachnospiraceae bacterium]|nr:nucleotide exchange factor GrpE [Lachnospiraceae bacterium]